MPPIIVSIPPLSIDDATNYCVHSRILSEVDFVDCLYLSRRYTVAPSVPLASIPPFHCIYFGISPLPRYISSRTYCIALHPLRVRLTAQRFAMLNSSHLRKQDHTFNNPHLHPFGCARFKYFSFVPIKKRCMRNCSHSKCIATSQITNYSPCFLI